MNALLRHLDSSFIIGLLIAFFIVLICYRWVGIYIQGKWRAYKRGYSVTTSNLFFMKSEGCFDEKFFVRACVCCVFKQGGHSQYQAESFLGVFL